MNLLQILQILAFVVPLVPAIIIYYTNSRFIISYYIETPLLETLYTMLYLLYIYQNELLSKFRLVIGISCVLSTFMSMMLNDVLFFGGEAGIIRLILVTLTLSANLLLYTGYFFQQYWYGTVLRKQRRSGIFIVFYILGAVILSGFYKKQEEFNFPIFVALMWLLFLVLHLNVACSLRASRVNILSAAYAQIGALAYLFFYIYTGIQFLKPQEEKFLVMKVLYVLANLLICVSGAVYKEETAKKRSVAAEGEQKKKHQ